MEDYVGSKQWLLELGEFSINDCIDTFYNSYRPNGS